LTATIALQLVDTLIVLFAAARFRAPTDAELPGTLSPQADRRVAVWIAALPLLALLVGLNFGYHEVLRQILRPVFTPEAEQLSALLWVNVLIVCVQPALVEELFFRKLALGTLRPLMGTFTAILISSLMFGLAHIYVSLSVPYLCVAGMVFGWARIASRGLALPILLHFLHNLVVLLWEGWSI